MAGTRAVVRKIEPGTDAECPHCNERVKFIAKQNSSLRKQVIANVYDSEGYWDRVEHFHADCYVEAGEPHGVPVGDTSMLRSS